MPESKRKRHRLSSRELRDLEIQAVFLEGLIRRDPVFADALQVLGDAYDTLGRNEESLRVDEQLAELKPGDPGAHYHLACSYAVNGRVDAAASALDRALDLGFRDFRCLNEEPDLQNLRRHPVFDRIRARLRRLKVDNP